jgi:CBS domain-containing protein
MILEYMLIEEIILNDLDVVSPEQTGAEILELMEDLGREHLPVVNNGEYMGMITEEQLYDLQSHDAPIGQHPSALLRVSLLADQHVYDAARLLSELKLEVMPVVDAEHQYTGYVDALCVLYKMTELSGVKEPGGILVLELNVKDYSMAEVAQIVESNNARILSSFVSAPGDSTKMKLTLKINRIDLSAIIKTFERYQYNILASYHKSRYEEDLKDRFALFMKYLNM